MADLYEVLGVSRDATRADIRSAYRRLSKTMHPDVGGDADAFTELTLAHDVLIDAERHHKYNRAGKTAEDREDNGLGQVLAVLTQTFNHIVSDLANKGEVDLVRFDILGLMKRKLAADKVEIEKILAVYPRDTEMFKRLIDRFAIKDEGENYMAGLLRAQLEVIMAQWEGQKNNLALANRAIEELKRYRFDVDGPMPRAGSQQMFLSQQYWAGLGGNNPYGQGNF